MKQPYTYTLPEEFIKDQSVPARWRVWAVINGFFITGQKCWASNEWIAEKIGSHKDTASQAVKELEELGIIRCDRGARSRDIYPMIGDNAYQWSASAPISDRHQRLSNSVSNSVREITDFPSENALSFTDEEIQIVSDGDEQRVARVKADPRVREIALKYMKRKGLAFKNDAHMTRDLARNMKTAKQLVDFTGAEILKGIEFCEEKFGDMWTLETVVKQMSSLNKKA